MFHFTGDLDAYNLELLRELAMRGDDPRRRRDPNPVDPTEEDALQERKQWLESLGRAACRPRRARSGKAAA
jgi:hypothetical protein